MTDNEIESCLQKVLALISPEAGITKLYDSQRKILKEFIKGENIVYIGNSWFVRNMIV